MRVWTSAQQTKDKILHCFHVNYDLDFAGLLGKIRKTLPEMYLYICLAVAVAWLLKLLLSGDPEPILGIYSQPNKWYTAKWWAFRVMFSLRQRQNKKQSTVKGGQSAGYGMRSRSTVEEMERAQPLPKEHPQAVDAVYFNGASKDGYYFVGATARRHNKLVQTLMYLRVPGLGLLQLTSLPDTCLYTDEEDSFSAGGLKIEPVQAMKQWKLTFTGKMRLIKENTKEEEEVDVNFVFDWKAYTPYFDFDTDLNIDTMCDAMAREKWNKEFFERLKKAHQTHHEQFGEITGTVHIGKYGDKPVKMQGLRDHSYGDIRNWRDIHRYGIQYLHLEDGTAMCVGNICMPDTMSRIIMGYVMHPDGRKESVAYTDFYLHSTSEDGNSPKTLEFRFIAGRKNYHLKGEVLDCPKFYMGYEWESCIHERMCAYTVNGVPGWGISEWAYRNHTGRPEKYRKEGEPLR